MEDLKNNNIPCQAIFFKDVAAGSQSSLKVENTVFSKISASYGCVLTVENYDLVITFNKVCITDCKSTAYQGIFCSKTFQTRSDSKLDYLSIRLCKSPLSMIYYQSSDFMISNTQKFLSLTNSNYSNCEVLNDKENGFEFRYFRKNFQYNTIESNSAPKYCVYFLDANIAAYSNSITNCNFLKNNAPDGIFCIEGFSSTFENCVFKGNTGYCLDSNRNSVVLSNSYVDSSNSISWAGDPITTKNVYISSNPATYKIDFYYTYNCLTITPKPNTPTPKTPTPKTKSPTPSIPPETPYSTNYPIYNTKHEIFFQVCSFLV